MAMLATVPDEHARRVAADVAAHGHGYIRIDRAGRAEHVPSASWPTEHEADCPAITGGECRCPMGNL